MSRGLPLPISGGTFSINSCPSGSSAADPGESQSLDCGVGIASRSRDLSVATFFGHILYYRYNRHIVGVLSFKVPIIHLNPSKQGLHWRRVRFVCSRCAKKTMKIVKFAVAAIACLICYELGNAQDPLNPQHNFHAGIHSGAWTLEREQLLAEESKDKYRSCPDPYCARCAKHLADYGHEYQYLAGPHQRQIWYRGTAGNIAVVTQRGYDQHGFPYRLRGNPASAIVNWEYMQTLNHAIWEQVNARNAVAIEEAAQDRVILLTQLLADAEEQLRLTKEVWEQTEPHGKSCNQVNVRTKVVVSRCTKTYKQFYIDMKAGRYAVAKQGMCEFCLAQAQYQFDQAYVADVACELALARQFLAQQSTVATAAVRVALLSKEDADKATRFKRLQYKKPPTYKEILATILTTGSPPEEEKVEEQPEEIEP
jgi:hypothetical protein